MFATLSALFRFIASLCLVPAFLRAADITPRVALAEGDAVPNGAPAAVWNAFDSIFVDAAGALAAKGSTRGAATYRLHAQEAPGGALSARGFEGQTVSGAGPGVRIASFATSASTEGRLLGHGNDQVLARARLAGGTIDPTKAEALVLIDAAGARLVARQTQPLSAAYGDSLQSIGDGRLDVKGRVTFIGTGALGSYLLQYFEGNLSVLAHTGGPGPGPFGGTVLSFSAMPLVSDDGTAVVPCAIQYPEEFESREAIILVGKTGGSLVVRSGDPAPPKGWKFLGTEPFSVRSRNAAGQVLFRAVAQNGDDGNSVLRGLWLMNGNGFPELIAAEGTPIPGSTTTVDNISNAVVNARGDVAFHANGVILKRAGQPLVRLAYNGMQQPGRPSGQTFTSLATDRLQMDVHGNVLFASAGSVWVYTVADLLIPVAFNSQKVNHKGVFYAVASPQLVASASGGQDGRRRCLSDNGKIAVRADLSGPGGVRHAVLVATLPRAGEVNVPPVANDDVQTFTTGAKVSVAVNVLLNDFDGNNDPLTIVGVTQPAHGSAAINGNAIVYTPALSFLGEDTFTYTVSDGFGGESTAQVTLRNVALGYRGNYVTALTANGVAVGTLTVNVTATGRITGRVQLYNTRYALAGGINSEGAFSQYFWTRDPGGFTTFVALEFLRINGVIQLTGEVSKIPSGSVIVGSHISYTATPVARRSLALLPGIPSGRVLARFVPAAELRVPQGIGFAAGVIAPGGTARLSGRLPNATAFATTAYLLQDYRLAFLVQTKGINPTVLHGTIPYGAASEFIGALTWSKTGSPVVPNSGFNGTVDSRLCRYFPPAPDQSIIPAPGDAPRPGEFSFDMQIGTLASQRVLLGINDRFAFLPPILPGMRAQIVRANGLLHGSCALNGEPAMAFRGAYYPPAGNFAGTFIHRGEFGRVSFTLDPIAE
jgi:hypothetical protein